MSKKDVIEFIIGFICWAIAVVLSLLTSLGIMDINVVLNLAYDAIIFLCIVLVVLLLLWLSVHK